MPVQELQIQFYGENLGEYRASIDYPGVEITRQLAVDSKNYLFLYLEVSEEAQAGTIDIELLRGRRDRVNIDFEFFNRAD